MNYADKTKYPRTTARGEIQDVNKMGSRKPMKLNLGMAPKVIFIMMLDVLATVVSFFLGLWFRYDFSFAEIRPVHMEGFLSAIGLWCVITLLVFCQYAGGVPHYWCICGAGRDRRAGIPL